MTYNLRYDNSHDGVNAWPYRKGKVIDLLRKYDPDIIGTQEALTHQLKDIINALPEYSYVGVGRDDGQEKGEYTAILYKKNRFILKEKNTFWLSEHPDSVGSKSWDAALTRIATWATLKDNQSKKDFLIINTHFDHIGKEARLRSAQLIKEKIPVIANDYAFILTGDFNCTREEPPYTELVKPSQVTLFDTAPSSPPGTFCDFQVDKMECRPIDYIFISSQWKKKQYSVITDNDGTYYPSDHLPVLVVLQ